MGWMLQRWAALACIAACTLLAAAAQAQPYFGGLPQCVAAFDSCTASLGSCNANLATCQATAATCAAQRTQLQSSLDSCSSNLSSCTAARTQAQAQLATCNQQLSQVQSSATLVFTHTGAEQTFTVPVGVTRMRVVTYGAGGGGGGISYPGEPGAGGGGGGGASLLIGPDNVTRFIGVGGQGGGGGVSGATVIGMGGGGGGGGIGGFGDFAISVSAGQTYRVIVGGGGGPGRPNNVGGAGGYGGGGLGGAGGASFGGIGGGGGALQFFNQNGGLRENSAIKQIAQGGAGAIFALSAGQDGFLTGLARGGAGGINPGGSPVFGGIYAGTGGASYDNYERNGSQPGSNGLVIVFFSPT